MRNRIINLGKALVEELGLDPGVDTLARWMAHYIAEQIDRLENAAGHEKVEAEKHCFDTILKLWQHRSSLPNGKEPFKNFEPIFRALEKLDPESKQTYYFENFILNSSKSGEQSVVTDSVEQCLTIATGIDEAARVWLDYVFKQAVLSATDDKTIEWLNNSADLLDKDTSIIVRFLPESMLSKEEDTEKKREGLVSRIRQLEAFNDFNQELLSMFKQELEGISINDPLLGD